MASLQTKNYPPIDSSPPEVGEIYSVPCVRGFSFFRRVFGQKLTAENYHELMLARFDAITQLPISCWTLERHEIEYSVFENEIWFPVIGEYHTDPEFGFPHLHLGIDWRFLTRVQIFVMLHGDLGKTKAVPDLKNITPKDVQRGTLLAGVNVLACKGELAKIEHRPKHCRRDQPILYFSRETARKLGPAIRQKRMANRTCPHQGTDLRSCPVRYDGTIQCPNHGLWWDLETGAFVEK